MRKTANSLTVTGDVFRQTDDRTVSPASAPTTSTSSSTNWTRCANIDFGTRTEKAEKTAADAGAARAPAASITARSSKIGDLVLSRISAGFDGLLEFLPRAQRGLRSRNGTGLSWKHTGWGRLLTAPYFVRCSDRLAELFADTDGRRHDDLGPRDFMLPQGRYLRLSGRPIRR